MFELMDPHEGIYGVGAMGTGATGLLQQFTHRHPEVVYCVHATADRALRLPYVRPGDHTRELMTWFFFLTDGTDSTLAALQRTLADAAIAFAVVLAPTSVPAASLAAMRPHIDALVHYAPTDEVHVIDSVDAWLDLHIHRGLVGVDFSDILHTLAGGATLQCFVITAASEAATIARAAIHLQAVSEHVTGALLLYHSATPNIASFERIASALTPLLRDDAWCVKDARAAPDLGAALRMTLILRCNRPLT